MKYDYSNVWAHLIQLSKQTFLLTFSRSCGCPHWKFGLWNSHTSLSDRNPPCSAPITLRKPSTTKNSKQLLFHFQGHSQQAIIEFLPYKDKVYHLTKWFPTWHWRILFILNDLLLGYFKPLNIIFNSLWLTLEKSRNK